MLNKFKCLDIKETNTTYELIIKLIENEGMVIAQLEYAGGIASLMYAMYCTRVDTFIIYKPSTYTSKHSIDHWKIVDRVGLIKLYIVVLEYYLDDASWITSANDNKSISSLIYTPVEGANNWVSKKQIFITYSSMEYVIIALTVAAKEIK